MQYLLIGLSGLATMAFAASLAYLAGFRTGYVSGWHEGRLRMVMDRHQIPAPYYPRKPGNEHGARHE